MRPACRIRSAACSRSLIILIFGGAGRIERIEQTLDSIPVGQTLIPLKAEFGRMLDADASSQFTAQEPGGCGQGEHDIVTRILAAQRIDVNCRVHQLAVNADRHNSDAVQTRIVRFALQQLAEDFPNLVGDAQLPFTVHDRTFQKRVPGCQRTRSRTENWMMSPSRKSEKLLRPIPHSKPVRTSRTSS